MRPLSMNTDSDVEVVEDSEPERVQLRNKSASDAGPASRNHRRLHNAGLHTGAAVIEISGVCVCVKELNHVWTHMRLSRLRIIHLVLWKECDHIRISFC